VGDVRLDAEGPIPEAGGALMTILALEYFRSPPRYLGARTVGAKVPGLLSGPLAPLRLVNIKDPEPPAGHAGWARLKPMLAGICGSDLSTIAGRSSLYFSPLVSTPFVPGHEVVGELQEACDDLTAGTRVVMASVLSCAARGEEPVCPNCAAGATNRCDRVTVGDLKPGLQTGYCIETSGGWARQMIAHRSQLHAIPSEMSNEVAVLLEPFACALHAAARADIQPGQSVLVVGAGTVGILTLIAIKLFSQAGHVIVAAKHPKQRAAAKLAGADEVVRPEHAAKAVRRHTSAVKLTPERGQDFLLGGVDVAVECTGSKSALDLALRTTRAGGRVVVSGIPGGGADLTPVWFRELELVGAYTATAQDFETAIQAAGNLPHLQQLVGATYPLASWRDAIDHAMSAGSLGTFKVAFRPQD
jgi:threonine dehydrogenase-like Zn-dependent dehydrogenase